MFVGEPERAAAFRQTRALEVPARRRQRERRNPTFADEGPLGNESGPSVARDHPGLVSDQLRHSATSSETTIWCARSGLRRSTDSSIQIATVVGSCTHRTRTNRSRRRSAGRSGESRSSGSPRWSSHPVEGRRGYPWARTIDARAGRGVPCRGRWSMKVGDPTTELDAPPAFSSRMLAAAAQPAHGTTAQQERDSLRAHAGPVDNRE